MRVGANPLASALCLLPRESDYSDSVGMGEYEKPIRTMPSPNTRGDSVDGFSKTPHPNGEYF